MITGTLIAVALLLGYTSTVLCLFGATFWFTSASPRFVARNHRLTPGYKRVQAVIWLVCVTAGGFVTCAVAQGTQMWIVGASLTGIFIGMLWLNTWEARQRGLAHQIFLSLISVLGVVAGYGLGRHFLKV